MDPALKEYKEFVESRLATLEGLRIRPMMGVYVMHLRGKVLGFIEQDCVLLEDGSTAQRLLPDLERVPLFPGSKDFVLLRDLSRPAWLCEVVKALYPDLPLSKPRKRDKKESKCSDPFWQDKVDLNGHF